MEQTLPKINLNRSNSPDFKELQKQGIGVYQGGNRSQTSLKNPNQDIANLRYTQNKRNETSMLTIQEQRAIAKERVLQETESSMNNKLKTKTHVGIPLDEAGFSHQRREKSLNNSTSRALLDDARKSLHFNGKAPGDYNLPSLTGSKPLADSRNQNAPSFSMGRRSKMPFISSKHLGSFIVREEHVKPEISVFDYYDSRNSKMRGLQTMDQDKANAFKSLDQQLASAFSPSKNQKKKTGKQIGFTLNKLLAGSPGPQSQLLQDLDQNKKWEYKFSKAAKIGSHTKEFDKDRQFYANLLHLNKSKEIPGPGMYDNEVEPLSPKKIRDISPRQRKMNKSLDLTAAGKIKEQLEESKFEKKKLSFKPRKGASIGKSRRKIDVTMFSPSFNGHIKNGLWH